MDEYNGGLDVYAAVFEWTYEGGLVPRSDKCALYAFNGNIGKDFRKDFACEEYVPAEDRIYAEQFVDGIIGDGEGQESVTLRLKMNDGSFHWSQLVVNETDRENRVAFSIFDLGDTKSLLETGGDFGALFKSVINRIPFGFAIFDITDHCIDPKYVNDAALKILGFTRSEADEMTRKGDYGPKFRESLRVGAEEETRIVQNSPVLCRFKWRKDDGASFWISLLCSHSTMDDHTFYAVLTDSSKQLDEHRATWESDHLQLISETEDLFILDYDIDEDRIEYSYYVPNEGNVRGIIDSVSTAVRDKKLIHPESVEAYEKALEEAKKQETKDTVAIRANYMGRGYCWWRVRYVSIADDRLRVYRIVGYIDNIQQPWEEHEEAKLAEGIDFRKALTAGAMLSMKFDISDGSHMHSAGDKIPAGVPADVDFAGLMDVIKSRTDAGDLRIIEHYDTMDKILEQIGKTAGKVSCDIRIMYAVDGVNEWLWRGFTFMYLTNRKSGLRSLFVTMVDIDKKKNNELALRDKAERDALTGLLNRGAFEKYCVDAVKRTFGTLSNTITAFIMIDIDHFKRVNDDFGHLYGDKILKQLGATVEASLHSEDLAARMGGDEFAIFVANVPSQEILAERVRMLKAALARKLYGDMPLTVSLGIARYTEAVSKFDEFYEEADRALFKAKELGGDDFVFYSDELKAIPWTKHDLTVLEKYTNSQKRVYIRTFGYFDVFVDGEAIAFNHRKSKELLALLVDRNGGYIAPEEAVGNLWEDETANPVTHSRYRKVAMWLKQILDEYDVGSIIETNNGKRRAVPNNFDCDLYNYLAGDEEYAHLFTGSYLLNYSWGEYRLGELTQGNPWK